LLFPLLRERAPELATTLSRLDNDHARGEAAVREVEHALLAFEVMGESRRDAFEQAVDRYVTAYLEHMAVEESQVLPAAQRLLTAADWQELDAAFSANKDPLTGHEPADEYRELFHTIVNNAPAPIGLGGGSARH
jgi:hemerythrin-like domain-containing protein